jgi:hypothetical protein
MKLSEYSHKLLGGLSNELFYILIPLAIILFLYDNPYNSKF